MICRFQDTGNYGMYVIDIMYVLIYNEHMGNNIVNVTEARDNFAEILGRVRFGGEIVTVEKKGKPQAVIISPAQFQALQNAGRERFGAILQRIHARNADVSPEEVTQDATEEIEAVRHKGYEREE